MQCVCGYYGQGVDIFVGKELGDSFEEYDIYGNDISGISGLNGDPVTVKACPECGTLKVDYDDNPLNKQEAKNE